MIDTQEIRLGNWFLKGGKPFRVDSHGHLQEGVRLSCCMIDPDPNGGADYLFEIAHKLEPMPITTEILVKFFGKPVHNPEFPEYTDEYQVGEVNCFVDDLIKDTGFVMIELGNHDVKPVQYVHDMQNLIFELTKIKIK